MLALYLKITFRNMWKYKTQSLTGIFGLAFGLACFVPALYWLHYETSYDSFYPEAEDIYRVYKGEYLALRALLHFDILPKYYKYQDVFLFLQHNIS